MELDRKRIKISVIGLGYVGLPLAVEFSKLYNVVGFDINAKRINELKIIMTILMNMTNLK